MRPIHSLMLAACLLPTRAADAAPAAADAVTVARPAVQQLTPPRGWNSYTGYSIAVTQEELHKNIDFLAEHLLEYGYDTVTVDNGWFLSGMGEGIEIALDEFGRPVSHPHFFPKGLQHTIDYAHSKGIKFGIWLLRGINRTAVERNLPVEGTDLRMADIVDKKSTCGWAVAPWWNYGVDMSKPGAQAYYDSLVRKYADMGVDFIKFDDMVPSPAEVTAAARAIVRCGRPMILSLSPGDQIKVDHSDAYQHANMVRITSDIWDNRGALETTFARWEAMQDYAGPEVGSFLDMDMVPFGRLYVVNEKGGWNCKFTDDQKRTFMVQRALSASPLMLGGVLYDMDEFSLSLFKHPEILACNSNAAIGKLAHRAGKVEVWKTPGRGNPDRGWLGVFNRDEKQAAEIELGLAEIGLDPGRKAVLTDLWTNKELPAAGKHTFRIPPDGVAFLRYEQPADPAPTVIDVTDSGIGPDSGKDAVPGVRAAIEACREKLPATLVFPKDRCPCGHADGFQVSNCRGHIVVDGCRFESLMDDPIKVHGTSVKVIERKDPARLACKFMEGMGNGMTWGRPGALLMSARGFIRWPVLQAEAPRHGSLASQASSDSSNFHLDRRRFRW